MEYYGYAERSADSQVDWSTIGKNMSDMLSETNRIREEKKAAIDQASREYSNHLTEVPLGEHVGAKEYALRFADNASQYQLMQDRLLKQGALKLKDYVVARQNLIDGTDQAFTMLKNFQAQASEKLKRNRDGKSQLLELEGMKKIQDWGNLDQSDLYINPTTGALTIGKVTTQVIDGKTVRTMSKNPGDFTTISNANATLYENYDKFDFVPKVDEVVDKMGEQLDVIRKYGSDTRAGNIISTLDVTNKTGAPGKNGVVESFISMETQAIKGILDNDFNRLSILTEELRNTNNGVNGVPYKFVYSKEETVGHPEAIFLEQEAGSGRLIPRLTPEQEKASTEFIRSQMRLRYDKKTTMNPYNEPTEPEYKYNAGKGDERLKISGNFIAQLHSGDDAQVQSAINHFRGMSNVSDINRTPEGVTVTTIDGVTKDYPFYYTSKDGKTKKEIGRNDWVAGITKQLLGDDADVKKVWKGITLKSTKFNSEAKAEGGSENVGQKYVKFVDDKIESTKDVLGLPSNVATTRLQKLYDNLGFTFKDEGGWLTDKVKITGPQPTGKNAGKPKTITVSTTGTPEEKEAAAETIREFIKGNTSAETIYSLNDKGVFGKSTPVPAPSDAVKGGNVR